LPMNPFSSAAPAYELTRTEVSRKPGG
jgi:hypothetical protein